MFLRVQVLGARRVQSLVMKRRALVVGVSVLASLAVVPAASLWRQNARLQAAMSDAPQSQRPLRVPSATRLASAFPNNSRDVLEQSEKLTLFSLSSTPGDYDELVGSPRRALFHNHGVLGKTLVSGPAKSQLLASFDDGLVAPRPRPGMANLAQIGCFNPRHGIRATHGGRTIDLLICFSCQKFEAYEDGKLLQRSTMATAAAQPLFDSVLTKAKVPLAR